MHNALCLIVLAVSTSVAGCSPQTLPTIDESFPVTLPADGASLGPRIAQRGEQTILSWMERAEPGATLRFARYDNGKWRDGRTATEDARMFVNWADLPAVTPLSGTAVLAHWLSYSADGPYSYDVMLSRSNDGGENWTAPLRPHDDGTPTEHGFVSLYPQGPATGLVWLDGRKTPDSGMTLRTATVDAEMSLSNEAEIDALVCDCCQTDVAVAGQGPVLVYRDRTEGEVRDVYVARQLDGVWQPGTPIADNGWVIDGCPVNGPAIDASGNNVAVAWFTAAEPQAAVYVAVSGNDGQSFGDPIRISNRRAVGHVGVAIINDESFAVSWMESGLKRGYDIKIQAVTFDGQLGDSQVAGKTSLRQTVPQLVRHGDELLMAWSDAFGDEMQVVSVRLGLPGFYE